MGAAGCWSAGAERGTGGQAARRARRRVHFDCPAAAPEFRAVDSAWEPTFGRRVGASTCWSAGAERSLGGQAARGTRQF
jgi:hypothetical protein